MDVADTTRHKYSYVNNIVCYNTSTQLTWTNLSGHQTRLDQTARSLKKSFIACRRPSFEVISVKRFIRETSRKTISENSVGFKAKLISTIRGPSCFYEDAELQTRNSIISKILLLQPGHYLAALLPIKLSALLIQQRSTRRLPRRYWWILPHSLFERFAQPLTRKRAKRVSGKIRCLKHRKISMIFNFSKKER